MFLSFSQDLYNLQYYQIYNYNPINHDIITKIMMEQTPQNNKERFQEKREKRSKLKEFLPDDLVLEYSKNIKPHKWTFDGNLVNRRNLATDAETIFFKALEYYNNNTLDEHFLELEDNKEKQRHSLSITLEADINLSKGLEECAKNGEWVYYATILSKMIEMGKDIPKNVDEQMSKGLEEYAKNGEWNSYTTILSKMIEMGKIDFNNPTYQRVNEHINSLSEKYQSFVRGNIIVRLNTGQSLESLHAPNGSYAIYQSLVSSSIVVNQEIQDETKKIREPDIWWQEHGEIFGKLLALDSKLISGLIKEHISEGIPKLNGYITIYEQAISNTIAFNLIKQAIEDNRFNHPQELGSFLEIVNAYGKGGQMELLRDVINQKSNIHLNERASKELLGVIAMNLGIPKEEIKTNLNEWKTEFLPNLVSNDEMMVIKKMEEARELYLSIMKAVFKNLWKEFLFDKNQDDEVGRSVALHNAETRKIFEKNGINYDKWLSYDKHRDFIVSTEVVVDKKEYYLKILNERKEQVIKTLLPFSGILTEREYSPLLHILEG